MKNVALSQLYSYNSAKLTKKVSEIVKEIKGMSNLELCYHIRAKLDDEIASIEAL